MHYAAVDIGSPAKGNLGWAVVGPDRDIDGTDPDILVQELSQVVTSGPVVLGFEAPMYVPAGRAARNLLKARPGEGNRAWTASGGATVTATALAVVPWVLDSLKARVPSARAWQDWSRRPTSPGEILLFEAFVSGGPSDGHAADARAAVVAARSAVAHGTPSALGPELCMSLLGAALLHAGLTDDIEELRRQCHVVRAAKLLS